jgi:hypothetical protein
MSLLCEGLSYSLKKLSLPGILSYMAEKHASGREVIYEFLQSLFERKQTCRHYCDIIKPRIQQRFWWIGKPVLILDCFSHAKLVCSMIFFEFCFPKWT